MVENSRYMMWPCTAKLPVGAMEHKGLLPKGGSWAKSPKSITETPPKGLITRNGLLFKKVFNTGFGYLTLFCTFTSDHNWCTDSGCTNGQRPTQNLVTAAVTSSTVFPYIIMLKPHPLRHTIMYAYIYSCHAGDSLQEFPSLHDSFSTVAQSQLRSMFASVM